MIIYNQGSDIMCNNFDDFLEYLYVTGQLDNKEKETEEEEKEEPKTKTKKK